MSRLNKNITILTIGDEVDFDSYQKSNKEKESFQGLGFDYMTTNYVGFLNGAAEKIKTDKIIVFLYFPFVYWDKYIEFKNYRGVYGNRAFYDKFVRFWETIAKKANKKFRNKEVLFVNHPRVCGAVRDKMEVIGKLDKAKISQPKLYKKCTIKEIDRLLKEGHKFYIKPRYGSMGKGITFLSKDNWQTNFIFKNKKIVSRKSDYGWEFNDITGNYDFLKQLLNKDIIIQEGVDPLIINGKMVDLRIYTFLDKIMYIYPRKNNPDKVTTNISQGGKGSPRALKDLPKSLINKAKAEALKVTSALDMKFSGIDVIPAKNLKDVYVVDVNTFAGFPKRKTFNLAKSLAKQLGELNKKGKLEFQDLPD